MSDEPSAPRPAEADVNEAGEAAAGEEQADVSAARPGARWARRVGVALLGVLVGLIVAEFVFRARDGGTFPHLNLYVADEELGVRLLPGGEMGFRFRDNPATEIRINAQGYRGADWGEPGPPGREVVVVGDSQVFGLGVEEDETFSAVLEASLTDRHVRNAGVPTYGPSEMEAVVRELIEARRPGVVVYTVNMVNDLFEAERANRERHAVWDGWAVRRETMPDSLTEFPGRRWLMSRSHLVYGLRKLYADEARLPEVGFASEGAVDDLVAQGTAASATHEQAERALTETRSERAARLQAIEAELAEAEGRVDSAVQRVNTDYENAILLDAARGHPGDIVYEEYEESSRAIQVTAGMIRRGAAKRARLIERIRQRGGRADWQQEAQAALGRVDELRGEREALRARYAPEPAVPTVLDAHLARVKALCDEAGAELVVLVLPVDVQVSADEWVKYGQDAEHLDMEPTLALNRDIVASARRLGARAMDLTETLRAVSGARFLDHDIHMTPASHAAVAAALEALLASPAPARHPEPGLEEGRSLLPTRDEWYRTPEATVRGSSAAKCETVVVREWLRVTCLETARGGRPVSVTMLDAAGQDWIRNRTPDSVGLITSLVPSLAGGRPLRARFVWDSGTERILTIRWPSEGQEEDAEGDVALPEMAFAIPETPTNAPPSEESVHDARLCSCWNETYEERRCRYDGFEAAGCEPNCRYAYGDASSGCGTRYSEDCSAFLACAIGDPDFPPACPEGSVSVAPTGQCRALCAGDADCAQREDGRTRCAAYRGARLCL